MLRLSLLLAALALPASAQDYPRLHDVTGVASNDTLNVREAPSAQAGHAPLSPTHAKPRSDGPWSGDPPRQDGTLSLQSP